MFCNNLVLPENVHKKKRVLLLAPRFYDYYKLIITQLEKLGVEVTYCETFIFLENLRNNPNFFDWCYRYIRNPRYQKKHTDAILKYIGEEKFDILFTVSVFSPSSRLIDVLRKRNPKLETYIYFWDAFSTWDFAYQMEYFDHKFSFDFNDSIKYKDKELVHLPLFYTEGQLSPNAELVYDLVHIGSLHPKYKNRASVIAALCKQAEKQNLHGFFYLVLGHKDVNIFHYPLKDILKYLFNKEYRDYLKQLKNLGSECDFFYEKPLSLKEVNDVEAKAKCIIDVNIDRSGVAMRVIGALAAGKKVITSNKYIVNEKFYSPCNIYILDDQNPVIDPQFLTSPQEPVDMSYLRLDNWVKTIFANIFYVEK